MLEKTDVFGQVVCIKQWKSDPSGYLSVELHRIISVPLKSLTEIRTCLHTEYMMIKSKVRRASSHTGEAEGVNGKTTHPFAESGAISSQMWPKVFAFTQRERLVIGMKRNWNQRLCYSLMPKKVRVMCFFLPQVHRHKAQAQFPSFNRVCLSFCKNVPVQETSRVTTDEAKAAYIEHLWHVSHITELWQSLCEIKTAFYSDSNQHQIKTKKLDQWFSGLCGRTCAMFTSYHKKWKNLATPLHHNMFKCQNPS